MRSKRPTLVPVLVVLGALFAAASPAHGQAEPLCSEFEVGSPRWQRCVEEAARGGGGVPGSPGAVCSEFPVGSQRWRECVEDAATGGGLMPWIVVVPIGVMVIGMGFMFVRQFTSARRQRYSGSFVGRWTANWLIFVGLIELAIGIGSALAAARAPGTGGGYYVSALVNGGVGLLLLVIGRVVRARAAQTQFVEEQGMAGQGRVLSVRQTGVYVNENPQLELELDVELPGDAPYRAKVRSVVPFILLNRVTSGAPVPVKVDPRKRDRVVIDWERATAAPVAGAGGGAGAPFAPGGSGPVVTSSAVPGSPTWEAAMDKLRALGIQIPGVTDRPAGSVASPPQAPRAAETAAGLTAAEVAAGTVDARASIRSVHDTGVDVGGGRVVVLDLSVTVPGGASEEVKHAAAVPADRMSQLSVGGTVPVKVDPENVSQLFIDWGD